MKNLRFDHDIPSSKGGAALPQQAISAQMKSAQIR
jgi:hypothetical protein